MVSPSTCHAAVGWGSISTRVARKMDAGDGVNNQRQGQAIGFATSSSERNVPNLVGSMLFRDRLGEHRPKRGHLRRSRVRLCVVRYNEPLVGFTPSHEPRAGISSHSCTADHMDHSFNHTIVNHLHRIVMSYVPRLSCSAKNSTISRFPARDASFAGVQPA